MDVTGGDEVGLLDEVEQEVLFPFFVLEALVGLLGGGDRGGAQAGDAHHRVLPQREVVPHQVHLRLGELVGVGQQLGHHVHEGLGDAELVGRGGDTFLELAMDVVADQVRGAAGDFGVGFGDFLRVGQVTVGRFVGRCSHRVRAPVFLVGRGYRQGVKRISPFASIRRESAP